MLTIGHKTVLLDYDGVVFKNKIATSYIKNKSIEFIMSKSKLNFEQASKLNEVIYPTKGHTCFAIDDKKETLMDYNEFVFEKMDYNIINEFINNEDKQLYKNLIDIKNERDINFILYTNAPVMWCVHTSSAMGYRIDELFSLNKMFTSDLGHIKPMEESYNNIEKNIKERKIHFIDDKMNNVMPIIGNDKWSGFVINDNDHLYKHLRNFS